MELGEAVWVAVREADKVPDQAADLAIGEILRPTEGVLQGVETRIFEAFGGNKEKVE